jgi:S1-C subfamily serine protease
VIGVNTLTAANVDGISFAIPIDTAFVVIRSLLMHGKMIRPRIGFRMVNVLVEEKGGDARHHHKQHTRVAVVDVEKGSPADIAGIKPGDYIQEFMGRKVGTTRDVLLGLSTGTMKPFTVRVERKKEKGKKGLLGGVFGAGEEEGAGIVDLDIALERE